jgi:glycosyltransferase involved in cell wall biosynthesis
MHYFPGMVDLRYTRFKSPARESVNRLSMLLFNRRFNQAHNGSYANHVASELQSQLRSNPVDFIIAPAASVAISKLRTNIPLIYITDTTFKLLNNYYEWFSNFWPVSVSVGNRIEQEALQNASFVVLSSEWAKASVVNDYSHPAEQTAVIPFGANMEWVPKELLMEARSKGDVCNLLFIGREWSRKGGDVAVDTCRHLNSIGVATCLNLVGTNLARIPGDLNVEVYPHLNKSDSGDKQLFEELLRKSHFLILPTSAECFGIVFCEASGFGLPSLTYDTGGIASAVINGQNGYRLPVDHGAKEYASLIRDIYQDFKERYLPLSESSRKLYESTLNWNAWARQFINKVTPILEEVNRPGK